MLNCRELLLIIIYLQVLKQRNNSRQNYSNSQVLNKDLNLHMLITRPNNKDVIKQYKMTDQTFQETLMLISTVNINQDSLILRILKALEQFKLAVSSKPIFKIILKWKTIGVYHVVNALRVRIKSYSINIPSTSLRTTCKSTTDLTIILNQRNLTLIKRRLNLRYLITFLEILLLLIKQNLNHL